MTDRIEIVPRAEFGSCHVDLEVLPSGGVRIWQNDFNVYVGPEHVMALILALNRINRVMG